ncbi:MAG: DUF4148 domain-containing protein [Burkholderiaceae bacterium]|nr:DUF4148 domain-containing protein [Burkholderiaceae bacterium]
MSRLALPFAALLLAVSSAPALADEVRFVNNEIGEQLVVSPGTLTREAVIAELRDAQRRGEIAASYEFAPPTRMTPSKLTREQVRREAATMSDAERNARRVLYAPNA